MIFRAFRILVLNIFYFVVFQSMKFIGTITFNGLHVYIIQYYAKRVLKKL